MRPTLGITLLASAVITTTAFAGPFKETIARKDLDAIVAAIRKTVPPVDKAGLARCQPALDAYNSAPMQNLDSALAAAGCMSSSGNIGAAIVLWHVYVTYSTDRANRHGALVSLALASEQVGNFAKAAGYAEQYATEYPDEADAPDHLTRALCTRRQLGDVGEANRDAAQLRSTFKVTSSPEALCAARRPIVMPAKQP